MIAVLAEPILKVRDLTAAFPNGNGGLQVLNQISFDIRESEFVCLLGPSGSGKSTLLRIMAGLLSYQGGQVILDGRELDSPRRGVGIVFQKANLMPWRTVRENIVLPLELQNTPEPEAARAAQDLIELVGLQGFEVCLFRERILAWWEGGPRVCARMFWKNSRNSLSADNPEPAQPEGWVSVCLPSAEPGFPQA